MNEEIKNRTILVITVIFLLITVIAMAFVFAIKGEGKTKDVPKVYLKQVYSSDYELSVLNDAFYIGKYNGNMNVIIDSNGLEVVDNIDVTYDAFYITISGEYLFYYVNGSNLTTYVFNGSSFVQKHSYEVNDSIKPILYNGIIYGFSFIEGNRLCLIDINNADIVVLNNLKLVNNYSSYLVLENEMEFKGVVDLKGNVLIPFDYDDIWGAGNNFIVSVSDRKLLVDLNNNILIDNSKDIIYSNNYYVVVNDKNKIVLYDKNINVLTKNEINNGENVRVYNIGSSVVVAFDNYFYVVNDSVKKYDGNMFTYNNMFGYYFNNVIYILDDNLNVCKEISFAEGVNISSIDILPFIISVKVINGENTEFKNYDFNFESIKAKENIVYKGDNFFVYLNNKDDIDELIITDLRNDVINTSTGNKVVVNNNYVIIDGGIYKIVAE